MNCGFEEMVLCAWLRCTRWGTTHEKGRPFSRKGSTWSQMELAIYMDWCSVNRERGKGDYLLISFLPGANGGHGSHTDMYKVGKHILMF